MEETFGLIDCNNDLALPWAEQEIAVAVNDAIGL